MLREFVRTKSLTNNCIDNSTFDGMIANKYNDEEAKESRTDLLPRLAPSGGAWLD